MDESYVGRLVDKVWPHKDDDGEASYRENQREVVLDVLKAFYEDDHDNYILSAPTGFGKSPVCYTVAQVGGMIDVENGELEERAEKVLEGFQGRMYDENGYYVTPQNILLDQLKGDYGNLSTFQMLKGRANYTCSENFGKTCADGPCRFDKQKDCTRYGSQKERALDAPVTNTNFTLFMVHPDMDERATLVADEAHMMPEYVLSQVEIKLREDQLDDFGWSIPEFNSFGQYVDWMKPKSYDLQDRIQTLEKKVQMKDNVDSELAYEFDQTRQMESKFSRLVMDWKHNKEKWVVQHKQEYDERLNEHVETVIFRPITPYRFMEGLVFGKGEKRLISSATPPTPDLLGLDGENSCRLTLDSPFPVENRPCYVDPIDQMSSSNRMDHVGEVVSKTVSESKGNTIVHAHTYKFASALADEFEDVVGEDDVILQESGSREQSLEKWKASDATYFVSVNMYDGIDLKDDLCRTNVICVVPFPYLGDPQVRKRKDVEGDKFFNWETAMKIQQAYGRSTRSRDDWSDTIILDANFSWFFDQNREFFFDWFAEAIEER